MTPLTHDLGSCARHFTTSLHPQAGILRNRWPDSSGMGGRIRPEWVAGFARNGWPDSAGIGGRIQPEYATTATTVKPGLARNARDACFRSLMNDSSQINMSASRVVSRNELRWPNRRCASRLASAGFMPAFTRSSARSATWNDISRSISRETRLGRNRLRAREYQAMRVLECGGVAVPAIGVRGGCQGWLAPGTVRPDAPGELATRTSARRSRRS